MTRVPIRFTVQNPTSLFKNLRLSGASFDNAMESARRSIHFRLKDEILDVLRNSETYHALAYGPLDAHFGFNRGTAPYKANAIINKVVDNIEVGVKKGFFGRFSSSYIEIGMLTEGFYDLFSLPEAIQINDTGDINDRLPWLEWLLLQGDRIIIQGYSISFEGTDLKYRSRSGKAIMVEKKRYTHNQSWRVPPEYSGTENDNWLTRILGDQSFINNIERIVIEELKEVF